MMGIQYSPDLSTGRQAGTFEQHSNLQNVIDKVANPLTLQCLTLFHPTAHHSDAVNNYAH
jgi:hypothetical protein